MAAVGAYRHVSAPSRLPASAHARSPLGFEAVWVKSGAAPDPGG